MKLNLHLIENMRDGSHWMADIWLKARYVFQYVVKSIYIYIYINQCNPLCNETHCASRLLLFHLLRVISYHLVPIL